MNQTLSLRRFTQLNRWFWATNGQSYLLSLLALLVITGLLLGRVLTLDSYDSGIARNNIPYFLLLVLPAAVTFSTQAFSMLHAQNSALPYLMLPASRTEKFAMAILYLVLFLAGYSLFYYCTEALFFGIANSRLPAGGHHFTSELIGTPDERLQDLSRTAYLLFTVSTISLLSSLYFRQSVLIKTFVLLLGLLIILHVVYDAIVGTFFPGLHTHGSIFFLLGGIHVTASPNYYIGAPKLTMHPFVAYVFPWLLLSALWITARIRFNEIER